MVLLLLRHVPALEPREGLSQGLGPERREPVRELSGRRIRTDRLCDLVEDRAGVHLANHPHDRDAGEVVAADDCPVDGSRAPEPREERRVNVDRASSRQRQHLVHQQLPVGRHDREVWPQLGDRLEELIASGFLRLENGSAQLDRRPLHVALPQVTPTPGRAIGLRDHADQLVSSSHGAERGKSEVWRAPEEDTHAYDSRSRAAGRSARRGANMLLAPTWPASPTSRSPAALTICSEASCA